MCLGLGQWPQQRNRRLRSPILWETCGRSGLRDNSDRVHDRGTYLSYRNAASILGMEVVGAEQELEKLSIIPETMELNQADFQKLATGLTV